MPKSFFRGVHQIQDKYDGDASAIWNNNQRSATIVRRFLEFNGIGIKIAPMAANILARDFKIPMKDHINIDISPDRHVKKVFKRLGFISDENSNDELIYRAREFYPLYPGIFDLPCFAIGKQWCHFKPKNSTGSNWISVQKESCKKCYLYENCPKKLE